MIRHIVLTAFAESTSEDTIREIHADLAAVVERRAGAHSFVAGRSTSPEAIERGFQHGFTIDFDSWEALEQYATDAEHVVIGGRLVECANGGRDGLIVLDIEV